MYCSAMSSAVSVITSVLHTFTELKFCVSVRRNSFSNCCKELLACSDGNENDTFSIDPQNGNVIVARRLDWETCSRYNLTVMATDGVHRIYTEVTYDCSAL